MSQCETFSVVGWDTFQHYKDRDPPWIKLYRDLLSTESWVLGTDVSRLVQVASLLLAARYKNSIPLRHALIRKVASLDCSEKAFLEAVNHLVSTNFLQINTVTKEPESQVQVASTALEQRQSRAETEQSRADLLVAARPSASRFEEFWNAYPKKVKRKDAERVWRSKKLDEKADTLIADAIKRNGEDRKWLEGFAPDPPTYLRGERWNDAIEPARLNGSTPLGKFVAPPDDPEESAVA